MVDLDTPMPVSETGREEQRTLEMAARVDALFGFQLYGDFETMKAFNYLNKPEHPKFVRKPLKEEVVEERPTGVLDGFSHDVIHTERAKAKESALRICPKPETEDEDVLTEWKYTVEEIEDIIMQCSMRQMMSGIGKGVFGFNSKLPTIEG